MAGASDRRVRPLRVLFAFVWAVLGAGGVAVGLGEADGLAGLPTLSETERLAVLGYSAAAILVALLVLATARRRPRGGRTDRPRSKRRRRPLRMVLGVLSGVGGGMALAASELSIEPALMAGGLTGGGAASLVVSFWSFVTSKRRKAAPSAPAADPHRATIALESDLVAQQLRDDGWFVVEGMPLAMSYADYVAAGPAGVLAIQTFWTDVSEDGNEARVRARIAARKVRDVLHAHEIRVEVVPVVLVCGPLPDEITEAVAIVDDVAVLVARRSEKWRAELRHSNALGMERFELVRSLLSSTDPAELLTATA